MTFSPQVFFKRVRRLTKGKRELSSSNAGLWKDPIVRQAYEQMALPRRDIDTTLDDKLLADKFMARVIGQWQELGAAEPYWSSDTADKNRLQNIDDDQREVFYAAGHHWMSTLAAFESRSGVKIRNGVCVELGCGAGKYTESLAKRFERVVAIDVSAGSLAVCRSRADTLRLKNVTTFLLTAPGDLATFGKVDFFLSLSTLQHNPPPVQRMLLHEAFRSLQPDGFALFQTPDWMEGYTFSNKHFLSTARDAMTDCHCLSKTAVLDILEANQMRLLDFAPDFTVERFGSYTYFARKAGAEPARPRHS